MKDKPNVLLILTDDQRFDTISALSQSPIATPNFDRLVQRGTAFTRAHIMGGSCGAVCMPSRGMLHTSRTLYHLQDSGRSIPDDHVLLGEHLRAAGYHTWGCGKWHNGPAAFNRSFVDGDEIFFGGMADHWNVPAYHYDPSGRYDTRLPESVDAFSTNELKYRSADHIHAGVHSSEMLADAAVRFLKDAPQEPWMMYIATLAPHDPRTMPQRFLDMYDPQSLELPANFQPVHPFDNGELAVRDEKLAGFPRSEAEIRRHIAEYYAMITHLDHELGRVFDALDASGQADETLVVLAGDNGLAVGQHGLMGKQSMYEHSVRVPLVMAGPGVPQNQRTDALCYLIDVFPTLCEMLGLETPATVEGRSLVPCLNDASAKVRDVVHLAYRHLMRAVSDGKHKLVEYAVEGHRRTQLFDLTADPWELEDRFGDPAYDSVVEALRREVVRWRDELDDCQPDQGAIFWQGYDAA